jgi:hypothetical protein
VQVDDDVGVVAPIGGLTIRRSAQPDHYVPLAAGRVLAPARAVGDRDRVADAVHAPGVLVRERRGVREADARSSGCRQSGGEPVGDEGGEPVVAVDEHHDRVGWQRAGDVVQHLASAAVLLVGENVRCGPGGWPGMLPSCSCDALKARRADNTRANSYSLSQMRHVVCPL